jgi:hypothetical protein
MQSIAWALAFWGILLRHSIRLGRLLPLTRRERVTAFPVPGVHLPAALLGILGGWLFANQVLSVWSFIGLALAML